MFRDLVLTNRSYRRFHENEGISEETLKSLIDLARCTASGANLQSLKYVLSWTPERNATVFSTLSWAGYLTDWPGPVEGERPSAYIIILGDTRISKNFFCDHGIAAQTILLGAVEKGYGGCMFGSIDRDKLRAELAIDEHFEIMLVIALGKPIETVALEEVGPDGNIKYYRDAAGVHHVPKRALNDIIVGK
jgi:nitroreductase